MSLLYILSVIFLFFGVGVKYFKWYFLISGYNTMSKEKKKNVDIEPLGRLMGNFMILIGIIILASGVASEFDFKLLSSGLMMLILPITIGLIVFAQKYDHNNEKKKKKNKTGLIAIISITLALTVLIAGMLIVGILDPDVEVSEDMIIISGMYKRNIKVDDIIEVTIKETMPRVLRKTNGFNMGYTLRGSFNLEGEKNASIFVHEDKPPFIHIRTNDRFIVINFRDREDTEKLYEDIKDVYGKN